MFLLLGKSSFDDLSPAEFGQFFRIFQDQMKDDMKNEELSNWLTPRFSTTTATDKDVCSIMMMSSMQKYYSYIGYFLCGVPKVTLLGTPEDYANLVKKTDFLLEFEELKVWHSVLKPVLEQFHATSLGNVDADFWSRIATFIPMGSGGEQVVSGWISVFCPVRTDGALRKLSNGWYCFTNG